MSTYLIESKHTKEECMRAIDEVGAKGPEILKQYKYGCSAGEHTGWATVEAPSDRVAREVVPTFLRDRARVVEVATLTLDDIKAYHQGKSGS